MKKLSTEIHIEKIAELKRKLNLSLSTSFHMQVSKHQENGSSFPCQTKVNYKIVCNQTDIILNPRIIALVLKLKILNPRIIVPILKLETI